jgi:hypothetical protein
MAATQHTPAPWYVTAYPAGTHAITAANGRVVALTVRMIDNDARPGADARLIAAAPETLDALQGLLDALPGAHPAIQSARAAIAKATGVAA